MKIFIYGTLKRGECRAGLLRDQRFLGVVRTAARYRLYDTGSYPVLVEVDAAGGEAGEGRPIEGELWQVDDECLAKLDEVECVPDLYQRGAIELQVSSRAGVGSEEDVSVVGAQAYFFQGSVAGLRDCGACWSGS